MNPETLRARSRLLRNLVTLVFVILVLAGHLFSIIRRGLAGRVFVAPSFERQFRIRVNRVRGFLEPWLQGIHCG